MEVVPRRWQRGKQATADWHASRAQRTGYVDSRWVTQSVAARRAAEGGCRWQRRVVVRESGGWWRVAAGGGGRGDEVLYLM